MMGVTGEFPFAEVGGVQCVELAYRDDRFAMLLVRPAGEGALDEVEVSAERLSAWVDALEERTLSVHVPRFAFGPETHDLSGHLPALGLARTFDAARADFGRTLEGPEPLAVDQVMQVAEIAVGEEGTRASTTMAWLETLSARPLPTVWFDRPFLFVLRDRETGIALFLGRVGDPSMGREA